MIPDKFFLWNYPGDSLEQAVAEITTVLGHSGLQGFVGDFIPGNLAEFVALVCRNRNISPWWLLLSAQREQSVLSAGAPMEKKASDAWLGVVGQDVGRVMLPGYYGVYAQVERFCEVSSWLLGVESSLGWPENVRSRKQAPRYTLGAAVDIELDGCKDPKTGEPYAPGTRMQYVPASRGEFLQLQFTPHLRILATNEALALRWFSSKML